MDLDKLDLREFGIGKGISITTGFDVASQKPLDSRTVVRDLEELANMPSGMVHLGLTVFVIAENKLYQWKEVIPEDKTQEPYIGWGAIESEVAAKEILNVSEEINFDDTPTLMLQKNKNNFFPYTHEDSIFVDKEGKLLSDKYQTIVDESLKTMSKTIPGAINEVNDYLDEKLAIFNEQLEDKLAEIDRQVQRAEDSIQQAEDDLQEKLDKVEEDVNDRVDQMLQNLDNVILSDSQCDNIMEKIRLNLSLLENGTQSSIISTFKVYAHTGIVNESINEYSLSPLKERVTDEDILFVHFNSVYYTKGVDYDIDYATQKIVNITDQPWNRFNVPGCEITFDLIKVIEQIVTPAEVAEYNSRTTDGGFEMVSGIRHYLATVVFENQAVNEVYFNFTNSVPVTSEDKLFVHLNSIYLTEGIDYSIDYENNRIINLTDKLWGYETNIEDEKETFEFTFELVKK